MQRSLLEDSYLLTPISKQCPKDSKQRVNDKQEYVSTGAARCVLPVSVLAKPLEHAGEEQAHRFPRAPHSTVCTSHGQNSMMEKTREE